MIKTATKESRGLLAVAIAAFVAVALFPAMAWGATSDLAAGSVKADDSAQVSKEAKTAVKTQKNIVKVKDTDGEAVEEGVYLIAAAGNTERLVGAKNGAAMLQDEQTTDKQKWRFTFDYDRQAFIIVNKSNNKALTASDNKVVLKPINKSSKNQYWKVSERKTGFKIVSTNGKKTVLTISGSSPAAGAKIKGAKTTSSVQQRFWLFKTGGWKAGQVIKNGTYSIKSAAKKSLLTVNGHSVKNNTVLRMSKKQEDLAQLYYISHVKDGYYKIKNVNSGLAMTAVRNKVVQREYKTKGANAQLWKAVLLSDGTVRFVNKQTKRALDCGAGVKAKNLKVKESRATQKWIVSPQSDGLDAVEKKALYRVNKRASLTKYFIVVDLTAHEMVLFEKLKTGNRGAPWKIYDSWRVSSGAPGSMTPAYTGRVIGRDMYHGWSDFSHFLLLNHAGFFLHTVQHAHYNPDVVTNGTVGKNISHGCVRSPMKKAIWMYNNIPNGTKVMTYYK